MNFSWKRLRVTVHAEILSRQSPFRVLLPQVTLVTILFVSSFVLAQDTSVSRGNVEFSAEGMLARLRATDAVFFAGVTIQARSEVPASQLPGTTVRLTGSLSDCVLAVWSDPPAFQPRGTRPARQLRPGFPINQAPVLDPNFIEPGGYDHEGNQRQLSQGKSEYLFSPEQWSKKDTTIDYLLSPSGSVLKKDAIGAHVAIYRPDSPDVLTYRTQLMWTLGRWYSPFLDKIHLVEAVENGMIKVRATGTGLGMAGTWELLIDPKSGDLVRSAVFIKQAGNSPFVEIANRDTVRAEDRICARQGTYRVISSHFQLVTEFKTVELSEKVDDGFYSETAESITGVPVPRTRLHDHRQSPEVFQYTDSKGVTAPPRADIKGLP